MKTLQHPRTKTIPLETVFAGERATEILRRHPNASCVIQLTDAELRRGWHVEKVLAQLREVRRVKILGPATGIVE